MNTSIGDILNWILSVTLGDIVEFVVTGLLILAFIWVIVGMCYSLSRD